MSENKSRSILHTYEKVIGNATDCLRYMITDISTFAACQHIQRHTSRANDI